MKRVARGLTTVVVVWMAMLGARSDAVWAQGNDGSGPTYAPGVDISEFRPAEPGEGTESVSGPLMLTLAYSFIWLLAGAFLWRLWVRSRSLSKELDEAKARLEALDGKISQGMKSGREDGQ